MLMSVRVPTYDTFRVRVIVLHIRRVHVVMAMLRFGHNRTSGCIAAPATSCEQDEQYDRRNSPQALRHEKLSRPTLDFVTKHRHRMDEQSPVLIARDGKMVLQIE